MKNNNTSLNKSSDIISALTLRALLSVMLITLVGCSKAPPVSISECETVVSHVKSVLKGNAPSNSKMLKQCKAATDEARGCVMAADKPMTILQCDF
jgi:hypothetical protein